MSPQKVGERSLILLSAAAALALLVAMGALSALRLRSALDAGDWYAHTWNVLEQVKLLEGDLSDAGAGQSGYLLTGDRRYLEIYENALLAVPRELERLRQLTADNPSQQQRLNRLAPLIGAKLEALKETIALGQSAGLAAAIQHFGDQGVGKPNEETRALLADFEGEENELLIRRLAERNRERRETYWLIAAGSVLAALLMIAAAIALLRYVRRLQRAERSQRESEQRLSVTLSSIGDAVIATNLEGRVTFMNRVAQEMTGWGEREGRGLPLEEVFRIINEETRNPVAHPVEKVLRTGRIVGLANHTVLVRRDGREIPIDDSAAPIRDGIGDVMGVVLVFHDVTERKETQLTRERYLQAEATNQAKDQFLAMLSHELRSPLNAMLGWVRLLQRSGAQKEILDRALEVFDRNIAMQTKLINELLDMSRVIAGKLELDFEIVDLTALAHDCADSLRPFAEAKGIALEADVAAGSLPLTVRGEAERLHQVICNLLDNAIKFTPAGGRVVLALRRLDGEAEITVRDSGEGIAAAFLPHVFERFRQADASLSRKHGGLGIGLAIVEHLVQRHGGRVTAHSDGPGAGATFTVTLPLATAHPLMPKAAGVETEADGPERMAPEQSILLVEDDADTLEALRITLLRSGAQVFAASSAAEALEIFVQKKPTLIISDISLRGDDGYELIRAIRKHETGHTLAVAMTGRASNDDRSAALAAGFDEYITKPVDPEKLISFVKR